MKVARLALLSLACLAPMLAFAQWQWLDKDGHKVFSDQPPPSDVAPNRILKQPAGRGLARTEAGPAAAPVAAASATAGVDPALKPAGKDKALEEKKKQAAAAEAEKKKADEAKLAAARAENCSRARTAKMSLESGIRIATTNDKGEREYMDDDRRAAELRRANDIIARECRANDRQ